MSTDLEADVERIATGVDRHVEAAEVVASMTLDEKLGCIEGDAPFWPGVPRSGNDMAASQ